MAAQVLSFFQRSPRYAPSRVADWTQQELAEFYRVEAALIRAGIRVGTDRGLSDENEPWFVFYRTDDGEVVIHFARIDGEYLIAGPAYEEIARGFDFSSLVRNMVARHPLIRRSDRGDNIAVHPAALLVAVVGTAFFKSGEARAAESGAANPPTHKRPVLLSSSSSAAVAGAPAAAPSAQPNYDTAQLPANQAVLVLAAALLASDFKLESPSTDASTRSALTSAASALDFTDAPVAAAPALGAAEISANHAQAVTNTPTQTVSSVLSLVALLSTLPSSTDQSATADSNLGGGGGNDGNGGDGGGRHDGVGFAPAVNDVSNWALEVRLGSGALPNVEAIQLVRAAIGDTAAAQKISVIEVSKLPNILAELIAKGDHFAVTPAQASAHVDSVAPSPHATAPDVAPGQTPLSPIAATPPATGATTPSDGAITTPVAEQPHFASPDLVKQFIDFFVAHTSGTEIMQKGHEIVMFDSRVLHDVGSIQLLHSVTFHFDDGGVISLVGDHSAFLDVSWA
ncbi:hypothetical protein [uncultured Caulobacter sp.]|uniref:hypothetical protein n=1 Tax=uncultured Caulobacter sp. TaxID=158749 RepID=UPI00260E7B0C|nr:hypothetical protein [uncultured Caulobacter sp.]